MRHMNMYPRHMLQRNTNGPAQPRQTRRATDCRIRRFSAGHQLISILATETIFYDQRQTGYLSHTGYFEPCCRVWPQQQDLPIRRNHESEFQSMAGTLPPGQTKNPWCRSPSNSGWSGAPATAPPFAELTDPLLHGSSQNMDRGDLKQGGQRQIACADALSTSAPRLHQQRRIGGKLRGQTQPPSPLGAPRTTGLSLGARQFTIWLRLPSWTMPGSA